MATVGYWMPRTVADLPRSSRNDPPSMQRLAMHMAGVRRGVTLYELTSGTLTETQPDDMTTVAKTWHGGTWNRVGANAAVFAWSARLAAAGIDAGSWDLREE